ncbi:MAG TPA: paraquat-inducible protein A [Desulfobacterales bacterium]|jgi:paraquat-inducible protein A|nr:paraquat-inducible protein A [Desulfobacterales bacterium]
MTSGVLMACHDCDLLQSIPAVPEGCAALCRRCGTVLIRNKPKSFQRPLALLLAGVILFVMFNAFPFLTFKKEGLEHQTHVVTGIRQLADQGMEALAALVAVNLLIVPGLHLLASLYVLVPVSLNRRAPGMFRVFRYLRLLQPWHMVEIFMLGVLVSLVKLAKMAQIVPGVAVYSLTAFIFVMAAASAAVDPHEVWERWEVPR